MMYFPTDEEIESMIRRGIARSPHLTTRFTRAHHLLTAHLLCWHDGSWHAASATRDGTEYAVTFHACACPAAAHQEGPCKHRLALLTYRQILHEAMAPRIVGDMRFADMCRAARLAPNERLITNTQGKTPQLCAYLEGHRFPRVICRIRQNLKTSTWHVQAEGDLIALSVWLANAAPLRYAVRTSTTDEAAAVFAAAVARGVPAIDAAEAADLVLAR